LEGWGGRDHPVAGLPSREKFDVSVFFGGQAEYARDAADDLRRDSYRPRPFEVGVPGRADPGEQRNFLATQAANPAIAERETHRGWIDIAAPSPKELS